MLLLTLAGCLINHELYEERLAELLAEDEATADGGGEGCEALWYLDLDEDGYGDPSVSVQACEAPEGHVGNAADCDDGDPAVHPGAEEIPYDGVDNDCQGGDLVDVDGDGHAAVEAGGEDCDDADPPSTPGPPRPGRTAPRTTTATASAGPRCWSTAPRPGPARPRATTPAAASPPWAI
jgi:hypothetical protein